MVRYRVLVIGRVQGVFYRVSTRDKALELGVSGWVKNLSDGNVLFEAQGEESRVMSLIEWSKKGPMMASVSEVKVEKIPEMNESGFLIKH